MRKSRVVAFLASRRTACILLIVGAVFLAVEGTWNLPLHTSAPFGIYLIILLLSLALNVSDAIRRKHKVGHILNHLGIFLIIAASFFGAPYVTRAKLVLCEGESNSIAFTQDNMLLTLPFDIALKHFEVTYYDDGISPKQFSSHLLVDGQEMTTSVNHPCSYKGYTIFQNSYDEEEQRYSVLQLVRAPLLPVVWIGMSLLLLGSVLLLFSNWKLRWSIPIVLVLTTIFTIISLLKINFGTLMPALRSWWFVPHLLIYMLAYALMALALLMWIVRKKDKSDPLLRSSSALLVIGMLCGSIWAWQAWGDYWSWDSKENWAAVTWFLTLLYIHYQEHKNKKAFVIIILAFLALQITWYGVNYLPSATLSLHTYTQ